MLLAIPLLASFSAIQAREADGLLDALVPVQDQSQRSLQRGLQKGLAQVLVKQAGDSSVLTSPGVRQAMSITSQYVTEYGYTTIKGVGEEQEDTLALTASFSGSAINRLLHREQLPLWPANRMAMLAWLIRDDAEFGKQHVTWAVLPEAYHALEVALQRRGVPMIRPMLDLQDRLALRPEQAWDFDEEQYAAAAQRYNTPLWLAIRLYQSGDGGWRGTALVNAEGNKTLENIAADDVTTLVNQAVDRLVDSYSRKYSYVPQLQTDALLTTVENVRSYAVYREVNSFLENLELVESLRLVSINNDQLKLRLVLNGDVSLLQESLARDNRFEVLAAETTAWAPPLGGEEPLPAFAQEFRFRWVK